MPKKKKETQMNPYMKDSELKPCTFCKLTKKSNNNISSMIDDEENKVKNNKNNLTQKQMFGKVPSKKKTKGKKKSIY